MLADNKIPVLDLTNSTITSEVDLQTAYHSLNLCPSEADKITHGRKKQQKKTPHNYISESDTSEDEVDECLHTSVEEQHYSTIRGSAQAAQAAHAYTTAQCNPMVKRGPPRQQRVRCLQKWKKLKIRQHKLRTKISLSKT